MFGVPQPCYLMLFFKLYLPVIEKSKNELSGNAVCVTVALRFSGAPYRSDPDKRRTHHRKEGGSDGGLRPLSPGSRAYHCL